MPGAREVESLGFAGSTFRFAGRPGRFTDVEDLQGLRVATAYPGLVDAFLDERGVAVDIVPLDGAVESAVQLGVADCRGRRRLDRNDSASGGARDLRPVLLESDAVLIAGPEEVGAPRRCSDACGASSPPASTS